MTRSSPPPAGGCSPTPNGDLAGRCLLGRIAGANRFGAGFPPAGGRGPGRCAEPEPASHGGLRPTHEQSSVGGRAGKPAIGRRHDGSAKRLRRERDADRRARPVASRGTHGSDFASQAPSAARGHRHRPRSLGSQAAFGTTRRSGGSHHGNANTYRLFPKLGLISGVIRRKLPVVAENPVLTATYWRPSTA